MTTGNTPCGIAVPQDFLDGTVNMQLVRDFAQRAEELDYEGLWTQEGILGDLAILEPVGLLHYLAPLTQRLRLGISVIVLPARNPVQLAKSLASLDQSCGGRLTLGVGVGGAHIPQSVFGLPEERRVTRFVESVQILRALWTESKASMKGELWSFEDVAMEPKPVQKPHPPIWFGARSEPALKRAARLADGFMGPGSSSSADFAGHVQILRRALEENGRDPQNFPISKRVYVAVDRDRDRAEGRLREYFAARYRGNADWASQMALWGSRDECVDGLRALVEAGANHLLLNPVFDMMEHLELLAQDVVPHL